MTQTLAVVALGILVGVLGLALVIVLLRRKGASAPVTRVHATSVTDRIRSVGKLVGLEVHAKEIATSTKGWSALPPILLSQAKIAMIFHFEKQYFVDLASLRPADVELVEEVSESPSERARYRVHLPAVEGALRLTDVTPYDIQAGRIFGLIDVIQMNAQTQSELMRAAQDQAAELFKKGEARYLESARRSVEQHLEALFRLFDVDIELAWRETDPASESRGTPMQVSERMRLLLLEDEAS